MSPTNEAHNIRENVNLRDTGRKRTGNILLCGLSGCGKSSLGRRLAVSIGYGFIDLDKWIEVKKKDSVGGIIAKSGLEYFRSLELQSLREMLNLRNHVIALGGGTLTDSKARHLVEQIGTLVWLDVPIKELAFRLLKGGAHALLKRPLLANAPGGNGQAEVLPNKKELMGSLTFQKSERQSDFDKVEMRLEIDYSSEDISVTNLIEYLHRENILRV